MIDSKNEKIVIEYLDPVVCRVDRKYVDLCNSILWYKDEKWKNGQFHKEVENIQRPLVKRGEGTFNSGLLQRLCKGLQDRHKPYELLYMESPEGERFIEPCLEGIEFRPDQKRALDLLLKSKRGCYKGPTGSGKTILIAGLISAYHFSTVLVIVPTKELLEQTVTELNRWFAPVGSIGDGKEDVQSVTVALVNTLSKYDEERLEAFGSQWNVVIVDEHHRVKIGRAQRLPNSKTYKHKPGMYEYVLSNIFAVNRFGFSATPHPEYSNQGMAAEAFLGPLVGELQLEEAYENEILAKPNLLIYYVEPTLKNNLRYGAGGYAKIYEKAVVENRFRNSLVIEKAREQIAKGLTVLIMVEKIQHGENLLRLADIAMPGAFTFLHGSTPKEIRQQQREAFKNKKRPGVIATRIWSEGVNIKSIGCVINAVGGDSENAVMQRFGRGSRRDKGKTTITLIDFFDSNHYYLTNHSGKRLALYFKLGWLGN